MPEPESAQAKDTVTGAVLFHPAAFGTGETAAVMVGGAKSEIPMNT
jgi:hypothetical protein